jgi:hypothetical protein
MFEAAAGIFRGAEDAAMQHGGSHKVEFRCGHVASSSSGTVGCCFLRIAAKNKVADDGAAAMPNVVLGYFKVPDEAVKKPTLMKREDKLHRCNRALLTPS